ncbi:L,D-transpeptidase family protein [Dechloromonas sp. XY25]|uniref:L,D-transpeptidase family protein n=1 Tax=Dechloromonas hankyongensis TaxID=2908002 RepID=A0ABS9K0U5_9RHOO|nr:L,D-transpeptidase family protein [Dechloromonas hankyongensis]MCG2576778.1 L,D-transpeptidase family protein [Dechloromonas hankyongensis]
MRIKIRYLLLALAATVTAGAVAKLSDKPGDAKPAGNSPAAHTPLARSATDALAKTSPFSAMVSDSGPEETLARIFAEIEANRLSNALQLTEALLRQHPNYRLANLIKGDLLLAKAQPIQTFGALSTAPADKVADLRAEALVRLKAYREKPSTDFVPRYLLQMEQDQRYAIVVDTKRSRLYLYENDRKNGGRPRFVADYYVTHGKLGAEKLAEGDKKTPIGVYHVTANLPKQKLADLYGSGAFPLNYPNEWDKRQGRGGSGIWLHGTPSDTFARPPRASDGCVVLTNQDLDVVAKNLQVGLTPVIISDTVEWLSLDDWNHERNELTKTIEAWRADWESRDTARYLSHYSKRFKSGDQNFDDFAAQKKQVNASKEWIKVKVNNLSVFRNPGKEEVVVVGFEQDYRSNNLDNQMRKRQYWLREDGKWKIIYEGSA